LSQLLGRIPTAVGRTLGQTGLSGRLLTALRTTDLHARKRRHLESLFREVDHIVAVSGWAREVLMLNGVPDDKITLSRHGITYPAVGVGLENRRTGAPL